MDREVAMLELATAHAVALRLHEAGAADDDIAQALAVSVEAIPRLLVIAEAKLRVLLAEDEDAGGEGDLDGFDDPSGEPAPG